MSIHARQVVSSFSAEHLEAIARILGDTDHGLTGSQIGHLLAACNIPDVDSSNTKWKRLYNALVDFQNTHGVGNHVVVFINRVMAPVRYIGTPQQFAERRDALNAVLALCGMSVADDGKIRRAARATSLDEALDRANRMRAQLQSRNVHSDVLRFCDAEILAKNYFHAVFEAMKSVATKLRMMAGLDSDGAALVDAALSFSNDRAPLVALNGLRTASERSEQRGLHNLLKGLFGAVRNPLAHEAKIEWDMTEEDALDILTTLSLKHRKLDKASGVESSSDEQP